MKSHINLLPEEFKPQFRWICGSHLVLLVFFACLFSGVSYGGVYYWHSKQTKDVAHLQSLISKEQSIIEELTTALTERKNDPRLESKLANYIALSRSRGTLLNQINSLSSLKQRSFSGLFESFSDAHSSELWLTNFSVTPSELNIKGQISNPQALPMWISKLSQTQFFAGQQFDDASVAREQDVLVFSLNSKSKESGIPQIASTSEVNNERD